MTNTREVALDSVIEILEKGQFSHLVIKSVLDKYNFLDKTEKSFLNRLVQGSIERKIELDYIINQFSKTKTSKMKPLIRNLLRMSTYQIIFMDAIPDSAACNEAVKLAIKRGFSPLKGFVNGVLRSIARNKENIKYPEKNIEDANYLSIKYSMPEWLVTLLQHTYEKEVVVDILESYLLKRPLTVRINHLNAKDNVEQWLSELEEQGISYEQDEEIKTAYKLSGVERVNTIPFYEEGMFSVQDLASMHIVEMANIVKDSLVLDVCGAPGGKAIQAASVMENTGKVIVRDLTEIKIEKLQENIERSGLTNIYAEQYDAKVLDEDSLQKFDYVIADLPCSGLGVLGRKADIKYRLQEQNLEDIVELQKEILNNVWQYVKVGGFLIYSTCTIRKEENEEMTSFIVEQFPFDLKEEKLILPSVAKNTDGFYMALLQRVI